MARWVSPTCGSNMPPRKWKLRALIWNSQRGTTMPVTSRKRPAPAFNSTHDPKIRQAFAACATSERSRLQFWVSEHALPWNQYREPLPHRLHRRRSPLPLSCRDALRLFLNPPVPRIHGSQKRREEHGFHTESARERHATARLLLRNGRVYHLFSRLVYRAIARENLRNRREHSAEHIRIKLAILDFVLTHLDYRYLETEAEKVEYFCGKVGISRASLPAKRYSGAIRQKNSERYFVDKFPLFFDPESSSALWSSSVLSIRVSWVLPVLRLISWLMAVCFPPCPYSAWSTSLHAQRTSNPPVTCFSRWCIGHRTAIPAMKLSAISPCASFGKPSSTASWVRMTLSSWTVQQSNLTMPPAKFVITNGFKDAFLPTWSERNFVTLLPSRRCLSAPNSLTAKPPFSSPRFRPESPEAQWRRWRRACDQLSGDLSSQFSEQWTDKVEKSNQMHKTKVTTLHAGKTLGWAGATPLLCAQSRPKGLWGHSRPSPRNGDRVLLACIQRCNQPQCREVRISNKERSEPRWQSWRHHPNNPEPPSSNCGSTTKQRPCEVCRVPRLLTILRRNGSSEARLSQRQRVSVLAFSRHNSNHESSSKGESFQLELK